MTFSSANDKVISMTNYRSPKTESALDFFKINEGKKPDFKRSETNKGLHKKQKSMRLPTPKPIVQLSKLEGFGLNDDMADKEFPSPAQLA